MSEVMQEATDQVITGAGDLAIFGIALVGIFVVLSATHWTRRLVWRFIAPGRDK